MKKRRKKKKMRRSLIPALVAMTLILLILAASAGMFLYQRYSYSDEQADLNAYFGLSASDEVAIVYENGIAEEKGLLQEGRCYLDLDTVHAYLNDRFYVDYNEELPAVHPSGRGGSDRAGRADGGRICGSVRAGRFRLDCSGLCEAVFRF